MGSSHWEWSVSGTLWGVVTGSGLSLGHYGEWSLGVICLWDTMGSGHWEWSVSGTLWGVVIESGLSLGHYGEWSLGVVCLWDTMGSGHWGSGLSLGHYGEWSLGVGIGTLSGYRRLHLLWQLLPRPLSL